VGFARWYEEALLSRFIACACADPKIDALRAQVVPLAEGRVFEIGCGGGLNQPHYDLARVTHFAGIDPNGALLDRARKAASEKGWEADIREGVGEAIPFPDASFDSAVCTYTLCSVGDPHRTLSELRRILKPGGQLIFLEHSKSPEPGPAKWQRRIEPVWKRVMGNCHLTRPISHAVEQGGFALEGRGSRYMEKTPRWAGWMEWGVGVRMEG